MFNGSFCAAMGPAGWLFMIFFWGALIAAVVWIVGKAFSSRASSPQKPVEHLAARFASGEIGSETYDRVRRDLIGAGRR